MDQVQGRLPVSLSVTSTTKLTTRFPDPSIDDDTTKSHNSRRRHQSAWATPVRGRNRQAWQQAEHSLARQSSPRKRRPNKQIALISALPGKVGPGKKSRQLPKAGDAPMNTCTTGLSRVHAKESQVGRTEWKCPLRSRSRRARASFESSSDQFLEHEQRLPLPLADAVLCLLVRFRRRRRDRRILLRRCFTGCCAFVVERGYHICRCFRLCRKIQVLANEVIFGRIVDQGGLTISVLMRFFTCSPLKSRSVFS